MNDLERALTAVLNGDLRGFPITMASTQADLLNAAARLPALSVPNQAVTRVLTTWRDGRIASREVQAWASFVRRGYVLNESARGNRPLDIEYDDEVLLVEIIGRLDELGDLIDGEITDEERDEMLASLYVKPE